MVLKRRFLTSLITTIASCGLIAGGAASASASTVTVGPSVAAISDPANWSSGSSASLVSTLVWSDGAMVSPVSGTITTWRVQSPSSGGTIRLLVLRPTGGGHQIVASSVTENLTAAGLNSFSASIPIQAGDILAVNGASGALRIKSGSSGPLRQWFGVSATTGTTLGTPNNTLAYALAVNADVEVAAGPSVSAVSLPGPAALGVTVGSESAGNGGDGTAPASGFPPGTGLTVRGASMNLVTAVYFNSVPATQWWIDGFEQITVVVPPGLPDGPVTMRVGGVAGVTGDTPGVQVNVAAG